MFYSWYCKKYIMSLFVLECILFRIALPFSLSFSCQKADFILVAAYTEIICSCYVSTVCIWNIRSQTYLDETCLINCDRYRYILDLSKYSFQNTTNFLSYDRYITPGDKIFFARLTFCLSRWLGGNENRSQKIYRHVSFEV